MNEAVLKKILTIAKIDAIKRKGSEEIIGYNLYENEKMKYALFIKKQDGSETKAYQQMKSQGIMVGSSIGVAYKELPNAYEYKDKKTGETKIFNGMNRTIAWFSTPDKIEEYSQVKKLEVYGQELGGNGDVPEEETIDVSKIPF